MNRPRSTDGEVEHGKESKRKWRRTGKRWRNGERRRKVLIRKRRMEMGHGIRMAEGTGGSPAGCALG